ncbi:MAG: glycosyltransferase [Cyanobacteria bacterium J06592_8]
MTQKTIELNTEYQYPSFSIIYETENLASVELENIYRSLASIAAQDTSPNQAKEFLIIDGGDAPPEVIEQLKIKYPWIRVEHRPRIGYYEAKLLGAELATGDIIVYCDSDCVYEPQWLTCILTTFAQNTEINVVAGETSTPVRNAYELAIAFCYFFPRFSKQKNPYASKHYFLNAVAFRRDFLMQNPLPIDLPLYRGNCSLHSYYFCDLKGEVIWKHPQARATHEPPTPDFIFWRYLLRGRDRVLGKALKQRLKAGVDIKDSSKLSSSIQFSLAQKAYGIAQTLFQFKPIRPRQIRRVISQDSHYLLLIPLALPKMLWFELLYTVGSVITYFQPDILLKLYAEKHIA